MEPQNEDQETTLEVLAGMVKDAITRLTELEIHIAELEAQVGERTAAPNAPQSYAEPPLERDVIID